MIAIQVARIIANFSLFLDLTDDDTLDPDEAVQMMELLGADLQALDKTFLRELVDAFAIIAPEYTGEAQKLVRDIPYSIYLEERWQPVIQCCWRNWWHYVMHGIELARFAVMRPPVQSSCGRLSIIIDRYGFPH